MIKTSLSRTEVFHFDIKVAFQSICFFYKKETKRSKVWYNYAFTLPEISAIAYLRWLSFLSLPLFLLLSANMFAFQLTLISLSSAHSYISTHTIISLLFALKIFSKSSNRRPPKCSSLPFEITFSNILLSNSLDSCFTFTFF